MPKKVTVEDLARMVQRGFDETAQKADVEKLENRVYKIESAIIQINSRVQVANLNPPESHFLRVLCVLV